MTLRCLKKEMLYHCDSLSQWHCLSPVNKGLTSALVSSGGKGRARRAVGVKEGQWDHSTSGYRTGLIHKMGCFSVIFLFQVIHFAFWLEILTPREKTSLTAAVSCSSVTPSVHSGLEHT